MSPEEKSTIIFRDGWDPIGSRTFSEEEKYEARRNIESMYKEIGIILNLNELTFIDLYVWFFLIYGLLTCHQKRSLLLFLGMDRNLFGLLFNWRRKCQTNRNMEARYKNGYWFKIG